MIVQETNILFFMAHYHLFYLFLLTHTAGMFNLLSEDLEKMTSENNCIDDVVVRARIHTLLKRHGLILQTCKNIHNLYSTPIGIEFMINASSMCLISFVPTNQFQMFAFVFFYSTGFLFLFCFLGQRLTTAAENFEMSVYVSDWVSLNPKDQKLFLLMLL